MTDKARVGLFNNSICVMDFCTFLFAFEVSASLHYFLFHLFTAKNGHQNLINQHNRYGHFQAFNNRSWIYNNNVLQYCGGAFSAAPHSGTPQHSLRSSHNEIFLVVFVCFLLLLYKRLRIMYKLFYVSSNLSTIDS